MLQFLSKSHGFLEAQVGGLGRAVATGLLANRDRLTLESEILDVKGCTVREVAYIAIEAVRQ